jgi:hypothetical protein
MAKVKLAPAVESIRGHVGNMLFKRWEGQEIVGKLPDRAGIVASVNQLAQQDKFRMATIYGKAAMLDPETKQLYADKADSRGVPTFALMVADFLNAPIVDEIDLSAYTGKAAEQIRVRVSDDLVVSAVAMKVSAAGGALLETGAAVKGADGLMWTYTTTTALAEGQAVSIEVSATDKPGNITKKVQARP